VDTDSPGDFRAAGFTSSASTPEKVFAVHGF
jgi:hypothetical protein